MKAAILAGGAGTRLLPLTAYVPKQMIPLGGKLVIDYVIQYLTGHGIKEIVMLTSHEDYKIFQNYLGNGERHGVRIAYSVDNRVGTAGALHSARDQFDDTFVVYYGDVLLELDLSEMIEFHRERKSMLTIALSTAVPIDYGVATVESDSRVKQFTEKPILKEYPVSMGLFVAEPEVLEYCKLNSDLSADTIPALLQAGRPVFGYVTTRRHYDIGTFRNLEEIRALVEQGKLNVVKRIS